MSVAGHAHVTADSVVKAAGGMLVGVVLTAGTGAAADITLYDNPSAASGTILALLRALQGTSVSWQPTDPYVAATGIYADINGTGASAEVVYI